MPLTILAILPFYGANSPRYLIDAFERIGARIIRVGPVYRNHLGLDWKPEELPPVDYELPKEANWYVDGLIDLVTPRFGAPDLVILSEENYRNVIVNTEKVPSVLYSVDGWPDQLARREEINATISYSSQPYGNNFAPRSTSAPGWKYLSAAAAPWVHQYLGFERTVDFCLLATMYTKRPGICDGIRERGFSVKAGQERTLGYVRWCNRSLATLHNPGYYEIKYRFYESAAMGILNLSWHTPPYDLQGYKPWINYVSVDTVDTDDGPWPTAEIISESLNNIKKNRPFFQQIADAARNLTVRENSYYNRCAQIFTDLDMPEWTARANEKAFNAAWQEHLAID